MKLRKLSLVLLALLLAAMAMTPMVSAGEKNISSDSATIIEDNYIPADISQKAATAAVKEFVSRNALDDNWSSATVNPKPDVIFDVNGKKLFYLFSVEKNGKRIGEIKTAASKVLGESIATIGSGPKPLDMNSIKSNAREIVNQKFKNAKIDSINLVCYDYPKIGAMITVTKSGDEKEFLVIDAYDFSVIPKSEQLSFYNAIPYSVLSSRSAQWESRQNDLQTANAPSAAPRATVTKTISGFSLYPQQGANWCAFATAQMVSAYHGYSRTQQGIAGVIGVNPDDGASIELTRTNYYQIPIASGGLGKSGTQISYRAMFTFNDIKNEMDANRPIHTDRYEASSYHARAITGYSYTTSTPPSQYLYIYDPWPTNSGAVNWENWNIFYGQPNPVHAILYIRN